MFKTLLERIKSPEKSDIAIWLILLLPFFFFNTSNSYLNKWNSEYSAYSHGLYIYLIACYILIYEYFIRRCRVAIKITYSTLAFIAPLLFIWLLASISYTDIVAKLSFIGISFLLACYFFGYKIIFRFHIFFGLLLSITAVWDYVRTPLRIIGATCSSFLLKLFGITNNLDQLYIYIPEGIFYVDEECSGVAQLVVAISVSLIYAWHVKFSLINTFIAVSLAAVFAIISNIIRITIIIIAGHLTDMQHYLITVEHESIGWIVFALVIFTYFTVMVNFFENNAANEIVFTSNSADKSHNKDIAWWHFTIPILAIALVVGYQFYLSKYQKYNELIEISFPSKFAAKDYISDGTEPSVSGASHIYQKVLQYDQAEIDLHVYFFAEQKPGNEAISYFNKVSSEENKYGQIDKINNEFNVYQISNAAHQKLALQGYWVAGKFYNNKLKAKIANSLETIQGNAHIAYIVINTNRQNTRQLETFYQAEISRLNRLLLLISREISNVN